MAKQRIVPEGTPERVFQPVSTPVNLYYQPNLSAVDLSRTAQIIEALNKFSPQLERFTSDMMAVAIKKEREIGAMEATSGTIESVSAKATQAIEKAGGIAPWRYESLLDTYGRRLVREKYQAFLYQNIDDLSAVTNPDGTLRGPEYATQKMNDAFIGIGLPENSFAIARAAADEKSKIDSQFLPMVQARHADKLKEKNLTDLEDEFLGYLTAHATETLPEIVQGKATAELMDKAHRFYGESGGKPLVNVIVKQANSLADEGRHEEALVLLNSIYDGSNVSVGGRKVGATMVPAVRAAIDSIEEKRNRDIELDLRVAQRKYDDVYLKVSSTLSKDLFEQSKASRESGGTGAVSMTQDQAYARAEAALQALPAGSLPEQYRSKLLADVANDAMVRANSINTPAVTNRDAVMNIREQIQEGVSPVTVDKSITQYEKEGKLSPNDADRLRAEAKSEAGLVAILPNYKESSTLTYADFGLSEKLVDPMYAGEIDVMRGVAQQDFYSRIHAGIPAVMAKDEAERPQALADLLFKAKSETVAKFKESNKVLISNADRTNDIATMRGDSKFEAAYEQQFRTYADTVLASVDSSMTVKADSWLRDRFNRFLDEKLNSPEMASMPFPSRMQAMIDKMPVLADEFSSMMRNTVPTNSTVPEYIRRAILTPRLTEAEIKAQQAAGKAMPAMEAEAFATYNPGLRFPWTQAPRLSRMTLMLADEGFITEYPALYKTIRDERVNVIEDISSGTPEGLKKANYLLTQADDFVSESIRRIAETSTITSSGVYVKGKRSENLSNFYTLAVKSRGLTLSEWRNGKTAEGMPINPAMFDWNKDTLFRSQADLNEAWGEYQRSDGTEGVLSDILKAYTTGRTPVDLDDFLRKQAAAIMTTRPSERVTSLR